MSGPDTRQRGAPIVDVEEGNVPQSQPVEPVPRATRSAAVGALAIGAMAAGALTLGAVAIGAFAIGRLSVRSARIRDLHVDKLTVGQVEFLDDPSELQ